MRKLHGWAVDRFGVLIWLGPITIVSALVYLLAEVFDIPRLSVYWGSMWAVPLVLFAWATWDGWLDLQETEEDPGVEDSEIKTGWWLFRQDLMLTLHSAVMVIAAMVSVFQIGPAPGPLTVALLFAAGAIVTALAGWNRSDRWEVLRIRRRELRRRRERVLTDGR